LDGLSEYQVKIGTARKELLVKRERLRSAGRKVQMKRVEAGDAEAKLMNRLREFVNKYDDVLSQSLFEAYEVVAQIRDDLGEMEEDYLQGERDLTGEEWKYLDQDDTFYQFDIHGILPESIGSNDAASQDQRQIASLFPPPPTPPRLSDHSPVYLVESFSPYVPRMPPPPPPPPLEACHLPALQCFNLPRRAYSAIAAEVNDLKKEFDQLREKQAQSIRWYEGDEVLFENGVDVSEAGPTPSTRRYFDILHDISTREAEAVQLRVMGLDQHCKPTTLIRRNSDTVRLPENTLLCTATMRRTKTESNTSFTENDPATKAKILQWLLQYLKDNAVEKRLYWKTLEEVGVSDPVAGDWQERAEEFWGRDSLSENGDVAEPYLKSTSDMSHAVESCNDERSRKKCRTASSSLQDILDFETRHREESRGDYILGKTNFTHPDDSVMILLPPSPALDCAPERTLELAIPENPVVLDEKKHPEKTPRPSKGTPNHGTTQKKATLCLVQVSDASERKDSVISEHQKHAGQRGNSACITEIQEPKSESKDQKEMLYSTTLKPAPGTRGERKKEVHANTISLGPTSHSDATRQDPATTLISAGNATDYQSPETNGRTQVLSRSLSESKVETVSRTRRIWGLLLRNKLKRRKSTR